MILQSAATVCFWSLAFLYQTQPPSSSTERLSEITMSDFTKMEPIRSSRVSVFGIHLGQQIAAARASAIDAGLNWQTQEARPDTVEVGESKGHSLLLVTHTSGIVTKLTLTKSLENRLIGDSKKLFNPAALAADSSTRLSLLGREDRAENGGEFFTTIYVYDKEGIRIYGIRTMDHPVQIELFSPAKPRY